MLIRAVSIAALGVGAIGCRSVVLSEYGTRVAVVRNDDGSARGREFRNRGVDFRLAAVGDAVIAAADGIVRELEHDECAGYKVLIEHPRFARHTFYINLREATVTPGQAVLRGETIGAIGLPRCSGKVIHVHMELLLPPDQVPPGSVDVLAGTENPAGSAARVHAPTRRSFPRRCLRRSRASHEAARQRRRATRADPRARLTTTSLRRTCPRLMAGELRVNTLPR